MSQELYFGEVDVRRFDRFESLLERIASKLEEPAPSASTNTGSPKLLCELEGIRDSLEQHPDMGGSAELARLNAVITQLRAVA